MKVTELEPQIIGMHGKAWQCDVAAMAADCGQKNNGACLGTWIIHAPWAHPFWQYYALSLVHLRQIEGMPPAKIMLPGAIHEIFLFALDPAHMPEIDKMPHLLHPANFGAQWIAENDEQAIKHVMGVVQEICDGLLSPDTDFKREWVKRFSDSNLRR
jgi:hypothetical protein